jgi:hypothetical protein
MRYISLFMNHVVVKHQRNFVDMLYCSYFVCIFYTMCFPKVNTFTLTPLFIHHTHHYNLFLNPVLLNSAVNYNAY